MITPCNAAIELASIAAHAAGGLDMQQEAKIALAIQSRIDDGYLEGKIVTGDEDFEGNTVLHWEDFE